MTEVPSFPDPARVVAHEGPTGHSISLCMIVRNEAAMLPRFLEHAQGVWDELVVVDTGSHDDTVAIAEAAGARVLKRAWDDDFSAARNHGLNAAKGDWILFLDPDEWISEELKLQIRETARNPDAGACTLAMRNQLPHGNVHVAPLLRMFRRFAGVEFRYPIHEDVWTSLKPALRRTGQQLVNLSGFAEHSGYAAERAIERNKKQRDVDLLRKCINAQPEDLYSWYKLLEVAQFWHDLDLLRGTAQAFFEVCKALNEEALAQFAFAGEFLVLLCTGQFAGDDERSLRFLVPWEDRIPESAHYHLRCAELWEAVGEPLRAAADFSKCLALAEITRDRQLATIRPLLGLSRLAMAKGDLWEAWRHTETALGFNACDKEALLSAVFICREAAGRGGVADFVTAYEAVHGATEELSSTLAELAGDGGWAVAQTKDASNEFASTTL